MAAPPTIVNCVFSTAVFVFVASDFVQENAGAARPEAISSLAAGSNRSPNNPQDLLTEADAILSFNAKRTKITDDQSSIGDTMATCSVTDNDVLLKIYGKGTLTTRMYRNEVRPQFGRKMPSQQDVERIKESTHQCVREGMKDIWRRRSMPDTDRNPCLHLMEPKRNNSSASDSDERTGNAFTHKDHYVDNETRTDASSPPAVPLEEVFVLRKKKSSFVGSLADVIKKAKSALSSLTADSNYDEKFREKALMFQETLNVCGRIKSAAAEGPLVATINRMWEKLIDQPSEPIGMEDNESVIWGVEDCVGDVDVWDETEEDEDSSTGESLDNDNDESGVSLEADDMDSIFPLDFLDFSIDDEDDYAPSGLDAKVVSFDLGEGVLVGAPAEVEDVPNPEAYDEGGQMIIPMEEERTEDPED